MDAGGGQHSDDPRFPHLTILLLGLVTISAYGAWYYAFGVLLEPILADTGWPEAGLTATFSASAAIGALAAVPAGRLIDRRGSRLAFLAAAGLSAIGLGLASAAPSLPVFTVFAVLGGASLQSLGFYHITQATAVRAAPHRPALAIARLTIYGAFSSTVYLPLAAYLEQRIGWRATMRTLEAGTAAVLVVAAIVIRDRPDAGRQRAPLQLSVVLRSVPARRFLVASALIGLGVGTILVYQVPLMTTAGLPLATAAWMAGARGVAQVSGRIPVARIVSRLGARRSIQLAYVAITVGVGVLIVAGRVWVALIYVAVAGFGIGATSPLQGIYADELFERDQLGTAMGVLGMGFGLAGALGPTLVGLLTDLAGSRWWGVAIAVAAGAGAVFQMRPIPEPARSRL
ncbi:MAG: MFS transporter [Acidimicrobiia bacterium]|nr:MFS transporter [Acidimicrobiia bacterium]